MSSKLPALTGAEVIRALERGGSSSCASAVAITSCGTRTVAAYVIRTPGESWSGIHVRAWIASDCANKNGLALPAVSDGSSHCSALADGAVRYAMRTCVASGVNAIVSLEPRIGSPGPSWNRTAVKGAGAV